MQAAEIRARFRAFFEARGHAAVASSPLVPDDPSLLFVNAGMVQFKDAFLGLEQRAYARAVTVQKCLRVSGKHNDLENVGPSPRHHTFFEMLGNFSFGDYFKPEAIRYAYDFLTAELGVDPERLVFTVHRDDDAARRVWIEEIGVPPERVLAMGDKTNFWMMADVGPCGPTSELHYDFGIEHCTCGLPDCSVLLDNDCGRWLEVWNLVFMQYDQARDGSRRPLPTTGVDTGMGLERIAAITQGVYANYDTDLFTPILAAIQTMLGDDDDARAEHTVGYRVLADHGRAMAFLIADGVNPGNEGRGYVLRLIMRRAMRFGRLLGIEGPFLPALVDAVVQTMGAAYPELGARRDWLLDVVQEEEARFARTLEAGLAELDDLIGEARAAGAAAIPGERVFRLYDTYGFPPDLTRVVAEEHGLAIDRPGFDAAMTAQRARGRAGGKFSVAEGAERYRRLDLGEVRFVGYEATEAEGAVRALFAAGEEAASARAGEAVEVVLGQTPFYAESGGQVGDAGVLVGPSGRVRIDDTQRVAGTIVHFGTVEEGQIARGETVRASVDADRRDDVRRNHTATHLLHAALQELLGEHAQQRGSLVAPDRLRFDFAHLRPLTPMQVEQVERRVNAMVRADWPVAAHETSMAAARAEGATMLFGEKYGDTVRVVTIGDGASRELCGGTHLARTGEVGLFFIAAESSVGSGLRRIEALSGRGAEGELRGRMRQLEAIAELLGVPSIDAVETRLGEVLEEAREAARALAAARAERAAAGARALVAGRVDAGGVPVVAARVDARDAEGLRRHVDAVRALDPDAVIVLGAAIDGQPRFAVSVPDALASGSRGLHAGNLVKALAEPLGGRGGGRPTMAEAGGGDAGGLDAALAGAAARVREHRDR